MDQNRVSRSGFGMFCPDSDPKPDSNLLYLHGLFDIKNVAGPGQNNLDLPNCFKAQWSHDNQTELVKSIFYLQNTTVQ